MMNENNTETQFSKEIDKGERFRFGENWKNFLSTLNEARIDEAVSSVKKLLNVDTLEGKRLLDIGSGSGLFSLAAHRLGAEVYSFDFDPESVECARYLKEKYYTVGAPWDITQGSVLDIDFVKKLGEFDFVYSWGVLHHTGDMWKAIEHATIPVKDGGLFAIAIYNDQGGTSRRWHKIKKAYCAGGAMKVLVVCLLLPYFFARDFIGLGLNPIRLYKHYKNYYLQRGMSRWHDVWDWIGGYPFEVAKPEEIFSFCEERGFRLKNMKTCGGGLGCNEFLFIRDGSNDM